MQRNRFEVTGYLAAKPVLRRLPSGTPVANVRLGESYRYQDGDGKPQQHTNWHSLSFYADLSLVATTFNRGDNIFVEGTIEQRRFKPKDGVERTVQEVVVHSCHLIAPPRRTKGNGITGSADEQGAVPDLQKDGMGHDAWPVG